MDALAFVTQEAVKDTTIAFAKALAGELNMGIRDIEFKILNADDESEIREHRVKYKILRGILQQLNAPILMLRNVNAPDIADIDLERVAELLGYEKTDYLLSRLRNEMRN